MEAEDLATEAIHDTIQAAHDHVGEGQGAVLTGWVLMAEWVDVEGNRWLSKVSRTASGNPCPVWQQNGYLWEGLNGFLEAEDVDTED